MSPIAKVLISFRTPSAIRRPVSHSNSCDLEVDAYAFEFHMPTMEYHFDHEINIDEGATIAVLPGLICMGGGRVVSHANVVSLEAFIVHASMQEEPREAVRPSPDRVATPLFAKHAWLQAHLETRSMSQPSLSGHLPQEGDDATDSTDSLESVEEMTELQVESVFDAPPIPVNNWVRLCAMFFERS